MEPKDYGFIRDSCNLLQSTSTTCIYFADLTQMYRFCFLTAHM